MKNKLAIIPVGPPGVGKDTVIEQVQNLIDCEVIGTGEYFRKTAPEITRTGKLVPNDAVNQFIFEKVRHSKKDTLIINGYPRDRDQAESAITLLAEYEIIVIELRAPTDVLVQRQVLRGMCAPPEKVRPEDTDLAIIIDRTYSQNEHLEDVFSVLARNGISIFTINTTVAPELIASRFLEIIAKQRKTGLLEDASPKIHLGFGRVVTA